MNRLARGLFSPGALALAALLTAGGAHADSLRCADTSVSEGDAKVWLLRACGQPSISDAYCVRVLQPAHPAPYGSPHVSQVTCVVTEEWLYDRGPGNLVAVVRIREGKIVSIRYGNKGDPSHDEGKTLSVIS
ncbi:MULTISPECIES: DUF2845 domain-containing protein [unclassified Roseateles]|uniref:DUF2845 domain-containing protein n=1 Tax=unclassified Roseateles TaxID=2626991 RepID=UPI0009E90816|nr:MULTISPECIES: DUF2845 domain-containing protein [unclassified Roseateles]